MLKRAVYSNWQNQQHREKKKTKKTTVRSGHACRICPNTPKAEGDRRGVFGGAAGVRVFESA